MAAALVVIALTDAIFDGGFGIGITQKREIDATYVTVTYGIAVIFGLTLLALMWVVAPVVERFFHAPGLAIVLLAAAAAFPFRASESVTSSLLRREKQFKILAGYQLACPALVYAPVSILMAFSGYGVWSLVVGNIALSIATALSSFVLIGFHRRLRFDIRALLPGVRSVVREELIGNNAFFVVSNLLNWLALTGPNSIIGHSLGVVELGFYSRSWRLLDLFTKASAAPIQNVLMSTFARLQDDVRQASRSLEKSLTIAIVFFSAASAVLFMHADLFVRVSLGKQWLSAVPIVQILFVVLVPRCCYKVSESITVAFGKSRAAAWRQAVYAALMLGGTYLAVPYGSVGVAVAASVAVTLFYLYSLFYAANLVSLNLVKILKMHALGACVFVAICSVAGAAQEATLMFGIWQCQVISLAILSLLLVAAIAMPTSLFGGQFGSIHQSLKQKLLFR
jgi:PST family polysaccharide transporter